MMRAITDTRPRLRARHRRARTLDITLHIGAHRTATTSFQHYMRQNARRLRRRGIGFWGPLRTRAGLLSGVFPGEDRGAADAARRRLATAVEKAERAGLSHLVVSDENIAGQPLHNIKTAALYPDVGARLARVARAFDYHLDRVVISVRPQPHYWPSLMAYAVQRGHALPSDEVLNSLSRSPRSWRDVIREAASVQGGEVVILRHDTAPDDALRAMTCGTIKVPAPDRDIHLNAAPDRPDLRAALDNRGDDPAMIPTGEGPWQPFTREQRTRMAENWLDDEFWLVAGAGGIATYLPDGRKTDTPHIPERAGHHLPPGLLGRGHGNGIEERRLVGSG